MAKLLFDISIDVAIYPWLLTASLQQRLCGSMLIPFVTIRAASYNQINRRNDTLFPQVRRTERRYWPNNKNVSRVRTDVQTHPNEKKVRRKKLPFQQSFLGCDWSAGGENILPLVATWRQTTVRGWVRGHNGVRRVWAQIFLPLRNRDVQIESITNLLHQQHSPNPVVPLWAYDNNAYKPFPLPGAVCEGDMKVTFFLAERLLDGNVSNGRNYGMFWVDYLGIIKCYDGFMSILEGYMCNSKR